MHPARIKLQRKLAAVSGLAATLLVVVIQVVGGLADPGYSHMAQYISELGALGAPLQHWVNYGGFLPVGLLLLLFTTCCFLLLANNAPAKVGWLLIGGIAVAYLLASVAPCDPGCPAIGTPRQSLHNLGGLFEYIGGSIGIALAAGSLHQLTAHKVARSGSYGVAAMVLLAFYVMLAGLGDVRGAWQRVAECCLFGWVACVSVLLLRNDAGATTPASQPDASPGSTR